MGALAGAARGTGAARSAGGRGSTPEILRHYEKILRLALSRRVPMSRRGGFAPPFPPKLMEMKDPPVAPRREG